MSKKESAASAFLRGIGFQEYRSALSERFAEYFLIGTLLSISISLVVGALLAKLIFGQVRSSG